MTVERRDEPIDERQRRTAQLHRLAEFGPLDQLEAGHVVVSSRPALAGRLATYPRWMISLEQAARSARGHAPVRCVETRMAFAFSLVAAGTLLLVAGFIGIGLQGNAMHSAARI